MEKWKNEDLPQTLRSIARLDLPHLSRDVLLVYLNRIDKYLDTSRKLYDRGYTYIERRPKPVMDFRTYVDNLIKDKRTREEQENTSVDESNKRDILDLREEFKKLKGS